MSEQFPRSFPVPQLNPGPRPKGWESFGDAQKLQFILGLTLDDQWDLISIPLSEAMRVPACMSARMQAERCILAICARVGIEQGRREDWQEYLSEARSGALALDNPSPIPTIEIGQKKARHSSGLTRRQRRKLERDAGFMG